MFDGWIVGYQVPTKDRKQTFSNDTGTMEDGVTTLTFVRKRQSKDEKVNPNFNFVFISI